MGYATPAYQPSGSFMLDRAQQQNNEPPGSPIIRPQANDLSQSMEGGLQPVPEYPAVAQQAPADQADEYYFLADELFKMLKFVRKEEFTTSKIAYAKQRILSTFTYLCLKVNVFEEDTQQYNLAKSDILQRIFNCKDTFEQNQIWDSLLKAKVRP